MPLAKGSTTLSMNCTAAAASMALPPADSIAVPAAEAIWLADDTIPPVPATTPFSPFGFVLAVPRAAQRTKHNTGRIRTQRAFGGQTDETAGSNKQRTYAADKCATEQWTR
jgi:hypothetical protein